MSRRSSMRGAGLWPFAPAASSWRYLSAASSSTPDSLTSCATHCLMAASSALSFLMRSPPAWPRRLVGLVNSSDDSGLSRSTNTTSERPNASTRSGAAPGSGKWRRVGDATPSGLWHERQSAFSSTWNNPAPNGPSCAIAAPAAKNDITSATRSNRGGILSLIVYHFSIYWRCTRLMPKTLSLLLAFAAILPAVTDRELAEWAIRWEGRVIVEGLRQPVTELSQIPSGPFRIVGLDLTGSVMRPVELKFLTGNTSLRELYLPGPVWNPGGGQEDPVEAFKAMATLKGLERIGVGWHFSEEISIRDESFRQLLGLTELKDIRCTQCQLKDIDLSTLSKLRSLDVTYSPFSDKGVAGLAGLREMRCLLLRDTMVTDEGLKHLAALTNLEELDLSGTRISDRGLAYLRGMTKMRKLSLRGARMTDASLDVLAGMKQLEVLDLYRTQITNAGVVRLQELKELYDVDLRYSRVTSNGIDALRAALPGSKVQYVGAASVRPKGAGADRPADTSAEAIGAWVTALGGRTKFDGSQLRVISLASTPVSDAQLSHLGTLRGLERLNLHATQVGDLGIDAITGLEDLKELDLSLTTISDAGVAKLAKLKRLEVLRLDGTLIEGRTLASLAELPAMRELSLGGPRIEDEALTHTGKLTGLTRLKISHTEITDGALKNLAGLSKLQSLDVSGTEVGDPGLKHIAALTALRELYVNHARFGDEGLLALKPLTQLERIEMFRTRTGNAGAGALAEMKSLRIVKLDYTSVDDKGMAALAKLPELRELSLDTTNVTDAGVALLQSAAGLKTLNLYHTLVTDKGYQALKAALPDCEMVFDRDSALPNRRSR
ncbi:MAG: hypothetical protein FJW31_12860 [Acidobacteria bacterium]|nr:hypothetical protein [Acidobacteriota bacterium]